MYLLLILVASAAVPASLPDSVLFNDTPATMQQMRTIEGKWATSRNLPVMTFSAVRPGWMSLKIERDAPDWGGVTTPFPVAVTVHDGQLFISIAVRFGMPWPAFNKSYGGKECYGTVAVAKVGDKIAFLSLDEEKMRAANSWYPKVLPAWEGEQASCGDLVVRAEAAAHQRVVVILDPKSWFDGPLHRLPPNGRHTSATASERSRSTRAPPER